MDVYKEGIRRGYDPKEGFARVTARGFGFDKYRRGEKIDPKEQAAYNLNKILEKYPDFTKEARSEIQSEFVKFPTIATINLEALASVLSFLKYHPNPKPAHFKDENILPYFSRLIPVKQMPSEDLQIYIIRLKAEFLKYIIAINAFREQYENESEYEEEQEREEPNYGQEEESYE